MDYIECRFELAPFEPFHEILIAELAELPFESFVEEDPVVKAYIPESLFKIEMLDEVEILHSDQLSVRWTHKQIPQENWNKKWETSFDAVEIDNFCIIKAPFHPIKEGFKYELIIEPKMSFGTGHHETTQLMIKGMKRLDLINKKVLDMGSGTAVLAILAEKMGASLVHAIDIEDWAYENMNENVIRNNCKNIITKKGGEEVIEMLDEKYDCIFANINKNILLKQFDIYIKHLNTGGELLISGFFPSDVVDFKHLVKKYKLLEIVEDSESQWCMLHYKKR